MVKVTVQSEQKYKPLNNNSHRITIPTADNKTVTNGTVNDDGLSRGILVGGPIFVPQYLSELVPSYDTQDKLQFNTQLHKDGVAKIIIPNLLKFKSNKRQAPLPPQVISEQDSTTHTVNGDTCEELANGDLESYLPPIIEDRNEITSEFVHVTSVESINAEQNCDSSNHSLTSDTSQDIESNLTELIELECDVTEVDSNWPNDLVSENEASHQDDKLELEINSDNVEFVDQNVYESISNEKDAKNKTTLDTIKEYDDEYDINETVSINEVLDDNKEIGPDGIIEKKIPIEIFSAEVNLNMNMNEETEVKINTDHIEQTTLQIEEVHLDIKKEIVHIPENKIMPGNSSYPFVFHGGIIENKVSASKSYEEIKANFSTMNRTMIEETPKKPKEPIIKQKEVPEPDLKLHEMITNEFFDKLKNRKIKSEVSVEKDFSLKKEQSELKNGILFNELKESVERRKIRRLKGNIQMVSDGKVENFIIKGDPTTIDHEFSKKNVLNKENDDLQMIEWTPEDDLGGEFHSANEEAETFFQTYISKLSESKDSITKKPRTIKGTVENIRTFMSKTLGHKNKVKKLMNDGWDIYRPSALKEFPTEPFKIQAIKSIPAYAYHNVTNRLMYIPVYDHVVIGDDGEMISENLVPKEQLNMFKNSQNSFDENDEKDDKTKVIEKELSSGKCVDYEFEEIRKKLQTNYQQDTNIMNKLKDSELLQHFEKRINKKNSIKKSKRTSAILKKLETKLPEIKSNSSKNKKPEVTFSDGVILNKYGKSMKYLSDDSDSEDSVDECMKSRYEKYLDDPESFEEGLKTEENNEEICELVDGDYEQKNVDFNAEIDSQKDDDVIVSEQSQQGDITTTENHLLDGNMKDIDINESNMQSKIEYIEEDKHQHHQSKDIFNKDENKNEEIVVEPEKETEEDTHASRTDDEVSDLTSEVLSSVNQVNSTAENKAKIHGHNFTARPWSPNRFDSAFSPVGFKPIKFNANRS